jgi:DNA-binding MarR family transcriptional regulator
LGKKQKEKNVSIPKEMSNDTNLRLPLRLARAHVAFKKILLKMTARKYNISLEKSGILYGLHYRGFLTLEEIKNLYIKEHNTTSALIDRMCKEGLLKKKKVGNGRKLIISATNKAWEVYKPEEDEEAFREIFAVFSEEEKEQLEKLLIKLTEHELDVLHKYSSPFG